MKDINFKRLLKQATDQYGDSNLIDMLYKAYKLGQEAEQKKSLR